MFLYIKTNILRGYGIFKNDFAHPREPANVTRAGRGRGDQPRLPGVRGHYIVDQTRLVLHKGSFT